MPVTIIATNDQRDLFAAYVEEVRYHDDSVDALQRMNHLVGRFADYQAVSDHLWDDVPDVDRAQLVNDYTDNATIGQVKDDYLMAATGPGGTCTLRMGDAGGWWLFDTNLI